MIQFLLAMGVASTVVLLIKAVIYFYEFILVFKDMKLRLELLTKAYDEKLLYKFQQEQFYKTVSEHLEEE